MNCSRLVSLLMLCCLPSAVAHGGTLTVDGGDEARWSEAAALAGIGRADGDVRLRVQGTTTLLEIRRLGVVVRSLEVATATTEAEREDTLFLAASLLAELSPLPPQPEEPLQVPGLPPSSAVPPTPQPTAAPTLLDLLEAGESEEPGETGDEVPEPTGAHSGDTTFAGLSSQEERMGAEVTTSGSMSLTHKASEPAAAAPVEAAAPVAAPVEVAASVAGPAEVAAPSAIAAPESAAAGEVVDAPEAEPLETPPAVDEPTVTAVTAEADTVVAGSTLAPPVAAPSTLSWRPAPWLRVEGGLVGRPRHLNAGRGVLAVGVDLRSLRLGALVELRSLVRRVGEPVERPTLDVPVLAEIGWSPRRILAPHVSVVAGGAYRRFRQEDTVVTAGWIGQLGLRGGATFAASDTVRFGATVTLSRDLGSVLVREPTGVEWTWQPWTVGGTLAVTFGRFRPRRTGTDSMSVGGRWPSSAAFSVDRSDTHAENSTKSDPESIMDAPR